MKTKKYPIKQSPTKYLIRMDSSLSTHGKTCQMPKISSKMTILPWNLHFSTRKWPFSVENGAFLMPKGPFSMQKVHFSVKNSASFERFFVFFILNLNFFGRERSLFMLLKILDKLRLIFEKRKIGKSSAERKTKTIESTIFTKMIRFSKTYTKIYGPTPLRASGKISNFTEKVS